LPAPAEGAARGRLQPHPEAEITGIRLNRSRLVFPRPNMKTGRVNVLIRSRLLPDCIDQVKQGLLALARQVRQIEPACLSIELAQDLDDPTAITMIEKWSSREAYEGPHMQSSHMQSFIEQSGKYFAGPPDISFCHPVEIGDQ
jgi:quinol monooxygenase YgiN